MRPLRPVGLCAQVLTKNQQIAFEIDGANYKLVVEQLLVDVQVGSTRGQRVPRDVTHTDWSSAAVCKCGLT